MLRIPWRQSTLRGTCRKNKVFLGTLKEIACMKVIVHAFKEWSCTWITGQPLLAETVSLSPFSQIRIGLPWRALTCGWIYWRLHDWMQLVSLANSNLSCFIWIHSTYIFTWDKAFMHFSWRPSRMTIIRMGRFSSTIASGPCLSSPGDRRRCWIYYSLSSSNVDC